MTTNPAQLSSEVADSRRRRWLDAAAVFSLAALVAIFYRKMIRLWWMYDDPFHLNMLKEASLFATLHDRDIFRHLGTPLFTPLLLFSLKLDQTWFGGDAQAFYFHQLLAFCLLPPLFYLMLRLYAGTAPAFAATLMLVLAGPMMEVAPVLMLRHYVEGGLFAILSVTTFVVALRRHSPSLAALSALLYFVAASYKEIYVPLIAILGVLPLRSFLLRAKYLTGHVAAVVVYGVWRVAVIGLGMGPYGFVPLPNERWTMIGTLPIRALHQFAGSGSIAGYLVLATIVGSAIIVFIRMRELRLLIVISVVMALGPILPVATQLQPRWTLALWMVGVCGVAAVPGAVPRYRKPFIWFVLVVSIATFRSEWPSIYRRLLRMSDEARTISVLGSGDILRSPITPPVTIQELTRLVGSPARAVYDDRVLCRDGSRAKRIFEYDIDRREVRQITSASLGSACRQIRSMPLTARFTFEQAGSVFWSLGPYQHGTYSFILANGEQAYQVAPRGGFRSPGLGRLDLTVRYNSPEGWITYSPDFAVDIQKRQPIFFERR